MSTPQPDRSRDHANDERLDLLRRLVVDAGLEVLDRDGLGLSPQSITYARVFAYLQDEHGIKVSLDKASTWVVDKTSYLTGLTVAEGAAVKAPDGQALSMTVDGVETPVGAGSYEGKIVLAIE
jgi:hypothetical protein